MDVVVHERNSNLWKPRRATFHRLTIPTTKSRQRNPDNEIPTTKSRQPTPRYGGPQCHPAREYNSEKPGLLSRESGIFPGSSGSFPRVRVFFRESGKFFRESGKFSERPGNPENLSNGLRARMVGSAAQWGVSSSTWLMRNGL